MNERGEDEFHNNFVTFPNVSHFFSVGKIFDLPEKCQSV